MEKFYNQYNKQTENVVESFNKGSLEQIENLRKITRFFNLKSIKDQENQPDLDPNDDNRVDMFLLNTEMESELKKLFREDNLENLNPEKYSYVLSYLILNMDCHDLRRSIDEEKKFTEEIQQARELFMESCKKIYPDINKDSLRSPILILNSLKNAKLTNSDIEFEIDEVAEFMKRGKAESDINKLKEMARKINLIFSDIEFNNLGFLYAFNAETKGGDSEFIEEFKKKKALENMYIYEFKLVRDIVYKKLYGDENVSDKDAKKIDENMKLVKKGFISCIEKYNDIDEILRYNNISKIPNEIFYSKEVKGVVENKIVKLLNYNSINFNEINSFIDIFKIPSENLKRLNKFSEPSMVAVRNCIKSGEIEKAKGIGKIFGIKEEFIYSLAQKQSVDKKDNPDVSTKQEKPKKDKIDDEKLFNEQEKRKEKIIENVIKEGGFEIATILEDFIVKGQKHTGSNVIFERLKNKNPRLSTISSTASDIAYNMITDEEDRKFNGRDLSRIMREKKINEVVDISPMEERIYKTVTTKKGNKGIFGIGKTSDETRQEFTGKMKKIMHDEIVENGKNEQAVKVTYVVKNENWKTGGRTGQHLFLEIIIPESIAKEVKREIMANPIFIRNLAEKIMKEKILTDPKKWEEKRYFYDDSLRPNYEKWDNEEGGGRIYVQSEGDPRGWNENSIKMIN